MKNYVIGTLGVIILVLISLLYKGQRAAMPHNRFPILMQEKSDAEIVIHLNVFFSKKNCKDCLEVIRVLNTLPPHFSVHGVVPQNEVQDGELIEITGARFPLVSQRALKDIIIPWYSPSIVGVSPKGEMLFILPGVPGEKDYLANFLDSFYNKTYPLFLDEKLRKK